MGDTRRRTDPATTLAEFTNLMNATAHATLPCQCGSTEWTSEDPQQRAAQLCRACTLLTVCRAYALASGEKTGVWGGLVPAERRRLRREAAA
ncbi:WhiB family transcriptional regulator [Arthrobacter sp. ISL-5]|uniref:WhiB family transcriptional regulator n=1 Tax=Arthrobacter sp. ISL-5 TaxID=2819111 RepID=UPI001BE762A0|nr:WhiB family transcriptional regulator [Arthrobacter sp. ISL-5]MBT2555994.1 WhiB family transcriptional regulator [Arthrobacter sp. ISL-5]